jgi:putative hemolysin
MKNLFAFKPEGFPLEAEGVSMGPLAVRLARKDGEIEAAERLRYDIFYREYGAKPVGEIEKTQRDHDEFDDVADHLIVIDRRIDNIPERIVGTYRLIRSDMAKQIGRFYTSSEFDITKLIQSGLNLGELGRSCVAAEYRTRSVLQLLWQGIAEYVTHHNIGILFGCASFHGTNVDEHAEMLSYLYHYHRAEDALCPKAIGENAVDMNIIPKDQLDAKNALMKLPPLIKGYLRLGGHVGDGAFIDHQFNTIDICVVVKTGLVAKRYSKHYQRKVEGFPNNFPAEEE